MRISPVTVAILLASAVAGGWAKLIINERHDHDRDYPWEWKQLQREWLGCPSLSGTYAFAGDYKHDKAAQADHGIPLSAFIGEKKLYHLIGRNVNLASGGSNRSDWILATKQITHVVVKGPTNKLLQVTLWNGDSVLHQAELHQEKDFICDYGLLWLSRHGEKGSISKGEHSLQKAKDGSLVAKVSHTRFGLLIIVPYVESFTIWERWLPMQFQSANPPLNTDAPRSGAPVS